MHKNIKEARASTIKIKINGMCMNNCFFCTFNKNKELLDIFDLKYFFDLVNSHPIFRIIISGGEPTIHPQFDAICSFLRNNFNSKISLQIGTNLLPIFKDDKYSLHRLNSIIDTFDTIKIGCDDEHRNIHILEKMLPVFRSNEKYVTVNSLNECCSQTTIEKLYQLQKEYAFKLSFSSFSHDYRALPMLKKRILPCKIRNRDFLLNCNGDAFFCYQQEHEQAFFNLHTVSLKDFNNLFLKYDQKFYKFCSYCDRYE